MISTCQTELTIDYEFVFNGVILCITDYELHDVFEKPLCERNGADGAADVLQAVRESNRGLSGICACDGLNLVPGGFLVV
ncbi:unnamed protein product [Arabidopsis lyrata]|nr:unnamed protein product [Arabidopsis lyrata]